MNWDRMDGNWKQQAVDPAEEKRGTLADDDLAMITRERDELIGLLQERCGITREEAVTFTEEWRLTAAVALSRVH
ncbi:MAG: CsbD family protein [Terriglobia bacterium]